MPVVQLGPDVLGHPLAKLAVFAHVNHEDRRLYTVAFAAALIGVFLEYVVVLLALG